MISIENDVFDGPTFLENLLDSIHEDIMKLSDGKTKSYSFNNSEYRITATFDEIIDGSKYYNYTITLPNGEILNNLYFHETYSFLEKCITE